MSQSTSAGSPPGFASDPRLLAQAIVVLAFVVATIAVGWLAAADGEWYAPALALIVAARFAYDHFFEMTDAD